MQPRAVPGPAPVGHDADVEQAPGARLVGVGLRQDDPDRARGVRDEEPARGVEGVAGLRDQLGHVVGRGLGGGGAERVALAGGQHGPGERVEAEDRALVFLGNDGVIEYIVATSIDDEGKAQVVHGC